MRIRSITLENFGPYFGIQPVDLWTSSGAPVVLMHGENMRGKTSIFHAIRWCLYERVTSHAGEKLTIGHFANWDMRDSGESFPVSVTLVIEEAGETFTLKRWATCSKDVNNPDMSRAVDPGVSLISSTGVAFPAQDIRDHVNELLNEDFADLFLFDAETLASFEAMLKSEMSARDLVRDSIEKSLGLTAFSTLLGDLREIRDQADRDLRKTMKGWNAAKAVLDKLDVVKTNLESRRRNLAQVRKDLQTALDTKDRLWPAIQSNITFSEKQSRRAELEREIAEISGEVDERRSRISLALKSSFWIPCNHQLRDRVSSTRNEFASESQKSIKAARVEVRQDDIASSLDAGCCVLCQQDLTAAADAALRSQIAAVKADQEALEKHQSALGKLQRTIDVLEGLADATAKFDQIKDWDADIRSRLVRIDTKIAERDRISDQLKTVSKDFTQTEADYNEAITVITQSNFAIPLLEADIEKLEGEERTLRAQVRDMSDDGSPLRRKLEVIDELIQIYETSVKHFRERMREEVQKEASRIFRELTTEPEYGGLRISPNYYLTIVDGADRVVPRRSAGAEQVVALSLIGALVECAVREAPLVIDTPLGRLDQGHRNNILTWLPKVGSQVMLFVTSGEFDEARDRSSLGTGVGREYDMVRITAWRTEIRKHQHV